MKPRTKSAGAFLLLAAAALVSLLLIGHHYPPTESTSPAREDSRAVKNRYPIPSEGDTKLARTGATADDDPESAGQEESTLPVEADTASKTFPVFTVKVGDRNYVYPPYGQYALADGGVAREFVGKILENFEGIQEITFSLSVWNRENPGTSEPDVTGRTCIIRGNDMILEKDGKPILKYVDGLRYLYQGEDPTPTHIDKTEEGAPLKLQAMMQRFPWDRMTTIWDKSGKDGTAKKYMEVATKVNEARATIDPNTMEVRRLYYVQEATGGGGGPQLLPIETEYLDYIDIQAGQGKTFRFPSRIKVVINSTKHQYLVLSKFNVTMNPRSP